MTIISANDDPFHGLADEASATLCEFLVAQGLADEVSSVMPPFERAVRAVVATVEASLPADLPLDFALAYLTGRIAKEQVIALQSARDLVNTAHTRAKRHWHAAVEAERRQIKERSSRESNQTQAV